jgi:type I restriction enzyme S subunit
LIPIPTNLENSTLSLNNFVLLNPKLNASKSIYQQKLEALEALKKSLLHQAFTGEL